MKKTKQFKLVWHYLKDKKFTMDQVMNNVMAKTE